MTRIGEGARINRRGYTCLVDVKNLDHRGCICARVSIKITIFVNPPSYNITLPLVAAI